MESYEKIVHGRALKPVLDARYVGDARAVYNVSPERDNRVTDAKLALPNCDQEMCDRSQPTLKVGLPVFVATNQYVHITGGVSNTVTRKYGEPHAMISSIEIGLECALAHKNSGKLEEPNTPAAERDAEKQSNVHRSIHGLKSYYNQFGFVLESNPVDVFKSRPAYQLSTCVEGHLPNARNIYALNPRDPKTSIETWPVGTKLYLVFWRPDSNGPIVADHVAVPPSEVPHELDRTEYGASWILYLGHVVGHVKDNQCCPTTELLRQATANTKDPTRGGTVGRRGCVKSMKRALRVLPKMRISVAVRPSKNL